MTSTARASLPDTLFGGALKLHQPARGEGYRVNVDAVVLAWVAAEPGRSARTIDLGAGVGAVGLSLLYRDATSHVVLVEKDRALSELSASNLAANGWGARGLVRCADVGDADAFEPASAGLVVCNPPYVPPGRGRAPLVAKGARMGELAVFAQAARRALGRRGRACFIYPAGELATLLETLRAAGLEPKRLCFVHPFVDEPARVALVSAMPAKRGGLVLQPPLVERSGETLSHAMQAILAARPDAT